MKKFLCILLSILLLTGCSSTPLAETTVPTQTTPVQTTVPATVPELDGDKTVIVLSDAGITVDGGSETDAVFTSHDIIYYEDRDRYESGNPYGEGETADRHSADEAAAHTVVNITKPGNYFLSGKLSAGQIRVDLGEDAYEDPNAVVHLVLDGVDITCTVAPAILFLNVYECDGNWSEDTAKPDVDTSAAGANLILAGENRISGSYVAKIYKDKDGEKKLWKQDGAIYSYMSMNVFGPGSLDLTAENEGMDTELHLTIHSGNIVIRSGNDGINTNEDNVSVTTINGGNVLIIAGLGDEGDGIDSNGYLVINGGDVVSCAKPISDAGLDSDLGSFIHGGTVVALGSSMDWAESDSKQVTMNLQFAQQSKAGSSIQITDDNGGEIFSFDPNIDPVLAEHLRTFQGAIISCPAFQVDATYQVYLDGIQQAYTGTDVTQMRPGFGGGQPPEGFGGGQRPDGFGGGWGQQNGQPPELPEGETFPQGEMPDIPEGGFGQMPGGDMPTLPEGETMPEGAGGPGGQFGGQRPGDMGQMPTGEANHLFYMQDKVNFFSGLTAYTPAE